MTNDVNGVRSALYYPHTGFRTIGMLKTALLLWDQVEYIAPPLDGFRPHQPQKVILEDRSVIEEAMDCILVAHVPTPDEQDRAHTVIEQFLDSDLGMWLQNETIQDPYLMYPGKFAEHTYQMLQERNLAEIAVDDPHGDYSTAPVVGLVLMSVLADVCAGTRRRRITDQHAGYKLVAESFARHVAPPADQSRHIDELIDISLHLVNLEDVPLVQLLDFRKKEADDKSGSLRHMRRNFADAIDTTARAMVEAKTDTDRVAIQGDFEREMAADLDALSSDLFGTAWKVVFSRPVVMAVLTAVGIASPELASIGDAANSLYESQAGIAEDLRAVYQTHPMSWLHRQK